MLYFVEESFDQIALAIECVIAGARVFAVRSWRNHRSDVALLKSVDQWIGIKGLIADQSTRIDIFEKGFCAGEIVVLSWRQQEFDRIAQRISKGGNFGTQSSA